MTAVGKAAENTLEGRNSNDKENLWTLSKSANVQQETDGTKQRF